MSHNHDHGGMGAEDHRGRLAIAFGITAAILIAQAVGALLTGSLALLVDTAHMLTDASGLLLALLTASLTLRARPPHAAPGVTVAQKSSPRSARPQSSSPWASTSWSKACNGSSARQRYRPPS